MKTIVFAISKDTGRLRYYSVINLPRPSIENEVALDAYLEQENRKIGKCVVVFRVKNAHVIAAICLKKTVSANTRQKKVYVSAGQIRSYKSNEMHRNNH